MKWTTEKPTREGWYWYRWSTHHTIQIVRHRHGIIDGIYGDEGNIEAWNGLWSDTPISQPE